MRNEFTPDEVYSYIFRREVGYPNDLVYRMLQPCNRSITKRNCLSGVDIFGSISASDVFDKIKWALEICGALIIEDFQVFEEYTNYSTIECSGDYNNDFTSFPQDVNNLHSMLVVGANLLILMTTSAV
mmetsp:Transcript_3575/g.5292  ORF Transcript_3575/g.5292 Transcript_3575/m.5292 type:complete len:128 (+) Transcript_3575:1021-1404(+)